jgi:acetyl-CoA synthetase
MQLFNPPENLQKKAHIKSMEQYLEIQKEFEEDYNNKWLELAKDNLEWFKKPEISLNGENAPFYKWFED